MGAYVAVSVVFALFLILLAAIFAGVPPKIYAQRSCAGARWRRRFPLAQQAEIREFLSLFLDAFGFRGKYRLHFDPDDKIMDVYRAVPRLAGDHLELECLMMKLEERYGLDMEECLRAELTLGELFALATTARAAARQGTKC
jgi:hypothetical protein